VIASGPDIHMEDSARLFPNPASHRITLHVARTGTSALMVNIFDANGRVYQRVRYTTPDSFQTDINIDNLPNGHYTMEVKGEDNHFRWSGHFIKLPD